MRGKTINVLAAWIILFFSNLIKADDPAPQEGSPQAKPPAAGKQLYQVANTFLKNLKTKSKCYHNQYVMYYAYGGAEAGGIALVQNGKTDSDYFPPVQHIELKEGYTAGDIAPNFPDYTPSHTPVNYNGQDRIFPCAGTITYTPSKGRTKTLYLSHTDCNGFVNFILCQVSPGAYLELPVGQNNQPWRSATTYAEYFQQNKGVPTKYWQTILTADSAPSDLMNAVPGDILAWVEEPSGGHIMIIASKPKLVKAQGYYSVTIIDSTNIPRFKDSQVSSQKRMKTQVVPDTTPPTYVSGAEDITRPRSGVGSGEIHLYYDDSKAVKWSCQANTTTPRTYFSVFSIGRLVAQ